MTTGHAQIAGTWREPTLELAFSPYLPHPQKPLLTMLEWVKQLPGRFWDAERGMWVVTATGPNPDKVMADAGFEITYSTVPELAGVTSLQDLYTPVTMLSANRRTVLMRHRLAGYDEAVKLAGPATSWDKKRRLILVPVADILVAGQIRSGIAWTQEAIDRAFELHHTSPAVPGLERTAAILGNASTADAVTTQIAEAAAALGHLPADFGVKLFGFQIPGALAVAAGHTGLFDAPGVGKTVQFLAAASLLGAERIMVICPPLVLTNWAREVVKANVAPYDQVAIIRTGRKEPSFEGKRVIIVSDSLLASRPETAQRLREWDPQMIGYDEAHRSKTMGAKRTEAVLNLSTNTHAKPVAITGTPLFASPHELIPLLEFTGHLAPVFGGPAAFLTRYCRQDHFGRWHARKAALPELRAKLASEVWVRRTKEQVLPDLPGKTLTAVPLDLDLAEYKKAHKAIVEKILEWLIEFQEAHGRMPSHAAAAPGASGYVDEILTYAQESIRFVSQLRQAAGLSKITAAADIIRDHVQSTTEESDSGAKIYTRPLVVWTHHNVVTEAMAEAIPKDLGPTGVIMGQTSHTEKNRLVDAFQAGKLPVLVCSITAAGVGITLTASSDVLFVESDWTPALITQAIDRCSRIGQTTHIFVNFLLALGTLDEHVQSVLETKGLTLTEVLGDTTGQVGVMGEQESLVSPTDIVVRLVDDAIKSLKKSSAKTAR